MTVSNLYLTREAAEALRKALDEGTTPASRCVKVYHLLDSLPVVDAVPAEEALDRIEGQDYPPGDACAAADACNADFATVRHALRMGEEWRRARDEMYVRFLEWRGVEAPCPKCKGSGRRCYASTATWRGGVGGQALTDDVCDNCWGTGDAHRKGANLHALRAAQAQADAPPPPDVIRRGHECLARLHIRLTTGEYLERDEQIEAVRAAMHPLPKEE